MRKSKYKPTVPPARERVPVLHHRMGYYMNQHKLTQVVGCIDRPIRVQSALFEGTVRIWVKVRMRQRIIDCDTRQHQILSHAISAKA